MAYVVRYHPQVLEEDLPSITSATRTRIARSIETRLVTAPDRYGMPLSGNLSGLWKLRVGVHRVVFEVAGGEVRVLAVRHRKDAYQKVGRRLM